LFCHPASGNYQLSEGSPCLPFTSPNEECDLIGAWDVGCNLTSVGEDPLARRAIHLAVAAPNPFIHSTTITYIIPTRLGKPPVRLSIYDPAGRLIRTLVSTDQPAGVHEVTWNGKNRMGAEAAAGVYFYQLFVNGEKLTRRAILLE
jgi:hypothetical protein